MHNSADYCHGCVNTQHSRDMHVAEYTIAVSATRAASPRCHQRCATSPHRSLVRHLRVLALFEQRIEQDDAFVPAKAVEVPAMRQVGRWGGDMCPPQRRRVRGQITHTHMNVCAPTCNAVTYAFECCVRLLASMTYSFRSGKLDRCGQRTRQLQAYSRSPNTHHPLPRTPAALKRYLIRKHSKFPG